MTDQPAGGQGGTDGGRGGRDGRGGPSGKGQGGQGGQSGPTSQATPGAQTSPAGPGAKGAPTPAPAPPPTEGGLDSPLLQHLLGRIEAQVVEVVRRELPAALLPATALRESLDAALPLLTELNRRVSRLETQVSGTEAAIVDKVLAALVQVTQHLEALQTATAWATLGELSRPQ